MKEHKKRIGIVGSGIAGLSAAWLLGQKYEVTLFEKQAAPGMGAFNLTYKDQELETRIDVPLRAFNTCHYKNLVALYKEMGVEMRRTDHSATYSTNSKKAQQQKTKFGYRYIEFGNYAFPILDGLNKLNLNSLAIVRDASRFLVFASRDRKKGYTDELTISEYLNKRNYSKPFIEEVLLPSFAAICTCTLESVKNYPAETIIDFLNSGMLFNGIWRAKHGAEDAIKKMLDNCQEIHCNVNINAVSKTDQAVIITTEEGEQFSFDHVVIASQANQAITMLDDDEADAKQLLEKIRYERSEVVVHGDPRLVPKENQNKAPVNFLIDDSQDAPMASIWLNKIYPELKDRAPLYQTWNPVIEPDAKKVVGRSHFERPIVSLESLKAIRSLKNLHQQKDRQIWYCGSYASEGIPLLESAVQSAMGIAKQLDCTIPWS